MSKELSDRERRFVDSYLSNSFNATEAAIRAGYGNGNNRNSAGVIGWHKLRNPKINAEIQKRIEQFHLNSDAILARWEAMADADMSDFIDVSEMTGAVEINLRRAKERNALHLIKKLTRHKDGGYTIELHDKVRVLDSLSKIHGMFTTKIEIMDWREAARRAGYKDPDSLFENAKREYAKKLEADDS